MRRFFPCFLLLVGCAAPTRVVQEKMPPQAAAPSHPWRAMVVYIPQTDDTAALWPKWFAKYPDLRMVIAMSPRFSRIAKDPVVKSQLAALQKEGRLEVALQIPNAPILPLLVEDPPYGYSDDVVQLIAQAKAGFFKNWTFLPTGLVLPYGASSPELVSLLERLGFSWMIGALGAPPIDGPYQSGSLAVWDGSPEPSPGPRLPLPRSRGQGPVRQTSGGWPARPDEGTTVHVWDEGP